MRSRPLLLLAVLASVPFLTAAQQSTANPSPNEEEVLGRRLYQQRCAVCHTKPFPTSRMYGPALYKDLISGSEAGIQKFIDDGSPDKMPGFKYTLKPKEVEAIIEYLKSVPRPRPTRAGNEGGNEGPVD